MAADTWEDAVLRVARRIAPADAQARAAVRLATRPRSHVLVLDELLGGPATVAELAEALGWPASRVGRDLRQLHRAGLVTRPPRRPRHRSRSREQPDVWSLVGW